MKSLVITLSQGLSWVIANSMFLLGLVILAKVRYFWGEGHHLPYMTQEGYYIVGWVALCTGYIKAQLVEILRLKK